MAMNGEIKLKEEQPGAWKMRRFQHFDDEQRTLGEQSTLLSSESPICRIHTDVLASIFLSCLDGLDLPSIRKIGEFVSGLDKFPAIHPSIQLSHVSSDWRELALHTPQLWSRLDIEFPEPCSNMKYDDWSTLVDRTHHQVDAWLRRSSSVAITVKLDAGLFDTSTAPKYDPLEVAKKYEAVIDTLCQASSRWKEVGCILFPHPLIYPTLKLFDRPSAGYMALTKLDFRVKCSASRAEPSVAFIRKLTSSSVLAAPQLKHLALHGTWGSIPTAKARVTGPIYGSIDSLELDAGMIDENAGHYSRIPLNSGMALKLLESFPDLTSVEIAISNLGTPFTPSTVPISLPNLTSMTLRNQPIAQGFGPSLDLPNLISLHLNATQFYRPNGVGQVELVMQVGHRLREFTLRYESISSHEDLSRCLKQLKNVVTLKLIGMPARDEEFERNDVFILSALSAPEICRRLEALVLTNVSNYSEKGLTEFGLVELLTVKLGTSGSSARSSWGRLRRVCVDFKDAAKIEVRGEMQRRGIEIGHVALSINYKKMSF